MWWKNFKYQIKRNKLSLYYLITNKHPLTKNLKIKVGKKSILSTNNKMLLQIPLAFFTRNIEYNALNTWRSIVILDKAQCRLFLECL